MPDDGLRSILHTHLRSSIRWQAIESGLTGGGIPDSYYISKSIQGWVESKATKEWAVTLEPAQIGWLLQNVREGGNCFVAVRRHCKAGPRRPAADELWLLDAAYARELRAGGLRGCPPVAVLGVWSGGPASWAWDEVRAHLLSGTHSGARRTQPGS
jgi:hypothetical protein